MKKYTVTIPGSKSYTNRSLILAALTKGEVKIKNPLFSDDTKAMINCLQTLGIVVKEHPKEIVVLGNISDVKPGIYRLNCRLSGTTIRFLLAFCCLVAGTKILTGEKGLNKRPIAALVESLKQLGAKIEYLQKEGFPPLKITSSKLIADTVRIRGDVSSQYFSALLMIAPLIDSINIEVLGEQISRPYIDMTIDSMKRFGVKVTNKNYRSYIVAANQKYRAKEYVVEGDFSSAGYFFALAVLKKLTITLKNLNPYSKQADIKFLAVLQKMGNKIKKEKNQITIYGQGIKPVNVNMKDFPDQVQTLSVLVAFAKGVSKITGIKSLRIKETERVKALQQELKKMGIKTAAAQDCLTIYGGNPHKASINTYNDHRMAMAFAVAGAFLPGLKIKNPEVVSKTFPGFWQEMKKYEN